jgi:enamine deaminase RidA (YjgF/YER057c/UK114 family)
VAVIVVDTRSPPAGSVGAVTVFIKEPRHGDRFVEIRRELFPGGRYPASTLITVANFARPGMEIEIQGIAVIDEGGAR